MLKRLFLESDFLDRGKLTTAQRRVAWILEEKNIEFCKDVFDTVIEYAWHDLDKVLEAIKSTDEIYANSSLMSLIGGDYTGSPVIMNEMMKAAIEQNITGKSLYFLREIKDMDWDMIKEELIPKAFKNNKLFFINHDTNSFEQAHIKTLIKIIKS